MRQQRALAVANFELAVGSAQRLLDEVSSSFAHGDITIKGAKDMLQVASAIVEQVHIVESTPRTTSLLIRLASTASDMQAALGNYSEAYANAQRAKDLAEGLLAADPDNPEVLALLYSSLWRIGDAIALRGADRGTQEQALQAYLEAEKIAGRLADIAPKDGARQRERMFIRQKIGDTRQTMGDLDAALADYLAALTIIQNVVAGAPESRNWRRDVATTQRRIGQALAAKQDFDGALEQLNAALVTLTKLAQEDANDHVVQSNLVERFQSSNHMRPSKQPDFSGSKSKPQLSGFMESVV
jgi:tetratricopeptide (TPR) repeat protein